MNLQNARPTGRTRRTGWKHALLAVAATCSAALGWSQTTITCTGTSGSFQSGSVNSAGTKNDGNMITVNSSANRGWAHYDLTSIPAGSTVTAVTANFTTYTSTSSSATNNLYGFTGDPASIAGPALYTACGSGTSLNASSWTANALNTKVLNATGLAFIQANCGTNNANIGYVRGSTNTYNVGGYPGAPAAAPDLVITFIPPTPCAGTPAPGSTLSTLASACLGQAFTLSFSGNFAGQGGITYQWESSPDGSSWTPIMGATNATYATTMAASTYYHCIVTCTNSGQSATSTDLQVTLTSNACQCGAYPAIFASNAADEEITNVTVGAMNVNSTCATLAPGAGSILNRYSNYAGTFGVTASQLDLVPFSLTQASCGGAFGNGFQLFVDWNQDGDFLDMDEFVYNQPAAATGNHTKTGDFTVPITALLGTTRMRVVNVETTFPTVTNYSNTAYTWGETEDYCFTVTASSACTGTPAPGNTLSTLASACPSTSFTLSLQNLTVGTGVNYSWETSPDGSSWSPAGGSPNLPSWTTTQAADTYYRCVVTCSFSGFSGTSTAVPVTTINDLCICGAYPAFFASSPADEDITNVTVGAMNVNSVCSDLAPGAGSIPSQYSNYTGTYGVTATQLDMVSFSLTQTSCGGSYGNGFQLFVDWNQDGDFVDMDEFVYNQPVAASGNHTKTGNFTVPITALLGTTRMRVVNVEAGFPTATNYSNTGYTWGETEDYCFTVNAAAVCSGTPTPGNTLSTLSTACPAQSFTLSLQNNINGSGGSYLWETSPDGSTWSPAGAPDAPTWTTTLAASTYYRCTVTCTFSGLSDVSTAVLVNVGGACECAAYCAVTNAGSACITNVQINTLNNTTAGCSGGTNYSLQTATTTLSEGLTYTFTMTCDASAITSVWFDWNADQIFDASEWYQVFTAGTTNSVQVTVPNGATLGNSRMRVRSRGTGNFNGAGDACTIMGGGETEDYCITIDQLVGCSGSPPANSVTGPASVCGGVNFTLGLQNPPTESGYSYQWYVSTDGGATYNPTGGNSATLSTSQTSASVYYCDITCTNSSQTTTSSTWTVNMSSFLSCYCTAGVGPTSPADSQVESVQLTGAPGSINYTFPSCPTGVLGVQDLTALTADLVQGGMYTISVDFGTCGGNYNGTGEVWIDYDQDGLFEAGESLGTQSGAPPGVANLNFTVPVTATLGITRMRVMQQESGVAPLNPCGGFTWGSVMDFSVNINTPVPCSGQPNPGNTLSTLPSVCASNSFTLSLQNNTLGTGVTYQWETSPDGSTWTPAGPPGSTWTTTQSTATWYRCVVTCAGNGNNASTPIQVLMNPASACICIPTYTYGIGSGDLISEVEIFGTTLLNNTGTATSPNISYTYYTGLPNYTASLVAGGTYTIEVTIGSFTNQNIAVWIDFNENGTFETPSERVGFFGPINTAFGSATFPLTLPCNPTPGLKRMRVREVYATSANTIDPCLNYGWGETEDYDVTILPPPPCPAPGNFLVSASTGSSASFTWNIACTETAWNIEWGPAGFTQGTGTTVPVTPTPTATIGGLTPGNSYEAYLQADCGGNGTSSWVGPITFSTCNGLCADAVTAVLGVNTTGPINCGNGATNAQAAGATHARWFTYTATGTGVLTASACGAVNTGNDDTRLTIHGGACGGLTMLASGDDECTWAFGGSAFASTASVFVTNGQQVFIEWDDRWNPAGFNWDLSFTPCTPDPADLCVNKNPAANPISIGNPAVVFTGTLDCQTQDGISPNPFAQATGWEWVAFELTQCANVQISYCGTPSFQYGALNMYGDCGTLFINSQTYDFVTCVDGNPTIFFEDLSPGNYYYPVLWSLPLNMVGPYQINVTATAPTNPCAPNINCAGALPLSCPGSVTGNTNNQFPTLPVNGCPFTGNTSGGSLWYTYTAAADENIILSTCGITTVFNTRISVYTGGACGSLSCYTMSDDFGGACTNRSQVEFFAQGGQTYYIAVHSPSAFDDGAFELQVGCGPVCPRPTNDGCLGATGLTSFLADGSGTPTGGDNSCAQNDAFTTCSPVLNNQGMWYSFNSGNNSIHVLDLLGSPQNGALTASQLNYALFSGGCNGDLSALGQVGCDDDGDGYDIVLTGLTYPADYLLYVYNPGSTGFEGTFEVMVEHPGRNDAGVTAINAPTGLVCTSFLEPEVVLTNFGENTLTSVNIVYDLDGGLTGPFVYNWTGSLPYLGTEVVQLPGFTAPYGTHTLNVTVQNPNGQVDEIPGNDLTSELNIDVTGETVIVRITTDNDPTQIYWEIQDQAFQVVAAAPAYGAGNTTVDVTTCLSTLNGNCFSFYLFDFLGDGLSGMGNGNGSWSLRTLGGQTLLGDDFNGTISGLLSPNSPPATAGYVSGHEFCLPPGPSTLQAGECGIFTNLLQNKVYATTVPGVTTYQFEFSDPDAGFRRRIAVPRNWVKFSEMVTSPLQPGVRYFTRVRVDQGAAGLADDRFGTGCEMGLDPTAVPGCTGLVDDIGFPAHSCGVIKTFGGSDKIFAQPVVGATQYRFRFENIGEGYLRTIVRPNYICPLNWVTLPLVNGSTYDVSVEVFYAGQWSGYCGPVCQVTILNPPAMAQQRDAEVVTNSGLQAWPNPVRDGAVNLRLDGLTAGTQRVSLEVYDLTGKRVVAQDMENSGPVFNTVLDLDGFAGGVYMVHLNVDGAVHQQRISVVK